MPTNVHMASPTQEHLLLTGLSYLSWQDHFVYNSVDLHQGERKVAAVEGKYRNEYVFILYVCYYYLYFCTEGNRFRAVYGYKSTKCSSHRQPLGVQNNCPYNLYAYSASCNIYNYIIYIHKYVIHSMYVCMYVCVYLCMYVYMYVGRQKGKKNEKEQSSTGWMWSLSPHRANTTQQVHHTM